MKRLLVSAAILVATAGLMAPASASIAKDVKEGPYGPVSFEDYGSCTNVWANVKLKTTYTIPKKSSDGYHVQFDIEGPFTSIAGQSPGACGIGGTDNGSTIAKGIKGTMVQNFHIIVSGGTFNKKAKCDETCATDYTFDGVNTFVSKFFKGSPTWFFSADELTHQLVTSKDKKLCAKKWELDYDPSSGTITKAKGDIATKCKK